MLYKKIENFFFFSFASKHFFCRMIKMGGALCFALIACLKVHRKTVQSSEHAEKNLYEMKWNCVEPEWHGGVYSQSCNQKKRGKKVQKQKSFSNGVIINRPRTTPSRPSIRRYENYKINLEDKTKKNGCCWSARRNQVRIQIARTFFPTIFFSLLLIS